MSVHMMRQALGVAHRLSARDSWLWGELPPGA